MVRRIVGLIDRGDNTNEVAPEYRLGEVIEAQHMVLKDSFFGKLVVQP